MVEARDLHEDFRRIHPAFEGELVRLRASEAADVERITAMFNDPGVLDGLSITFPQPSTDTRAFYEDSRKSDTTMSFVIEKLAGESIGGCGLHEIDGRSREAKLGIWIGREHWGQGYGADAVRVLCRFGFNHVNLARIMLFVYEHNERARHVYEQVGFRLEGTLRRAHFTGGDFLDVHVMGLLAGELVER